MDSSIDEREREGVAMGACKGKRRVCGESRW